MTLKNIYPSVYAESLADPEKFWLEAAKLLDWITPPQTGFIQRDDGMADWFPDGVLNVCDNAVDRHVRAGKGARPALIYDSAMTGTIRQFSYKELQEQVAQTAGMLAALGVGKGDRVLIYMPMIPETIFAMLACARLGAVHSVVFGGFASKELATRIDDAAPKLILTASCALEPKRIAPYKPLVDEAISLAKCKPQATLVFQRPQTQAALHEGDHDWAELVADAKTRGQQAPSVELAATDP